MNIADKILNTEQLKKMLNHWRAVGDSIVFTNGCFDILHVGHTTLLNQCAELGDRVIVGLNADDSVKQLKGESRPVNTQISRAYVLASLKNVDAVVIFDEQTPLELIKLIQPDVLVKGGDYKEDEVVGADVVKSNGGKTVIVPLVPGISTTQLIDELRKKP